MQAAQGFGQPESAFRQQSAYGSALSPHKLGLRKQREQGGSPPLVQFFRLHFLPRIPPARLTCRLKLRYNKRYNGVEGGDPPYAALLFYWIKAFGCAQADERARPIGGHARFRLFVKCWGKDSARAESSP